MFSAHLYRKQPAWYLQHRSAAEVVGEQFDVDGGGHEDETQFWGFCQQRAQDPQEEVAVEVSLMDLVHDQHLVLREGPVLLDLPEQQPLCQEQQFGGRGLRGLEADLVPHLQNMTAFCQLFIYRIQLKKHSFADSCLEFACAKSAFITTVMILWPSQQCVELVKTLGGMEKGQRPPDSETVIPQAIKVHLSLHYFYFY